MSTELLGYIIVKKSTGKKSAYLGVIPSRDKKIRDEYLRVYPPSKYIWVESRKIASPKTSQYKYH